MRQSVWILAAVAIVGLCNFAESRSLSKRQVYLDASIDPVKQEVDVEEQNRDKRKVEESFGVKNALLGFVFNSGKASSSVVRRATTPKTTTTTEEVVIFEPNKPVTLQVPDQLFGSSFNLVTELSTTLGEFAINSAIRVQKILETMRPFFWKLFGKSGIVIEATTDKPIFSDGSSN